MRSPFSGFTLVSALAVKLQEMGRRAWLGHHKGAVYGREGPIYWTSHTAGMSSSNQTGSQTKDNGQKPLGITNIYLN